MTPSEDLKKTYSALSTERLLAIVTVQASEYETSAVETALEELRRRGVDPAQPLQSASGVQSTLRVPFAIECSCNQRVKGCLVVLPYEIFFVEIPPLPKQPLLRTAILTYCVGGGVSTEHYGKKYRNDPEEKMQRLGIDIGAAPEDVSQALNTYIQSSGPSRPVSGQPPTPLYRAALKVSELQSLKLDGPVLVADNANGEFQFTLRSKLEIDLLVDALLAAGFRIQV